ncbi:bile acid:sodium symporter family protein [Natronolimnohabitans innermongolicus]|uniref:Sodium symporter n=1 Tax=Natronolimnohabitans innermongolicus JCM 12255 TaxID=1227499 RepID=L9X2N1_9EURY|nr:bile acid:sodium symporter [Natronolimnohabitans innermongolicus]ELY55872.1 sodium symporter [Natronolimnohabitans innermongolicus JCM 12255]
MVTVPVDAIVDAATTVFVLSTMLAMGLELAPAQLVNALRRRRLLAKSLLVNLVLVPLVAYAIVRLIPMSTGHAVGILLIAMAPGAPFGPKIAEISESDIAFASGLMAVLGILSVVSVPVTAALLIPGDVTADPLGIAQLVVAVQLVPLVAGLAIDVRYRAVSDRLYPPIQRLSDYSFAFLLVLLVVVYADDMLRLVGTGTLLASSLIVVAALLAGYVLGGPTRTTREVLATTTAARNAALALFIATTSFSDPTVLTMVLAFSFIGVFVPVAVAGAWRRRPRSDGRLVET